MGPLAERVVTVGLDDPYPRIPFLPGEAARERDLYEIGRAFQDNMNDRNIPCALKGGSALRLQLGISRPSTDLDFEGDQPIHVRKATAAAVARAGLQKDYRVGLNWLKIGTVRLTPRRTRKTTTAEAHIDYRTMGTRQNMPKRVDPERCEHVHGIQVYNARELIQRKLQTIIGNSPREKARDIYDAGWIVSNHPELIEKQDCRALKEWAESRTVDDLRELKARLLEDKVTKRVDATDVLRKLKAGIDRLDTKSRHQRRKVPSGTPGDPGAGRSETDGTPGAAPAQGKSSDNAPNERDDEPRMVPANRANIMIGGGPTARNVTRPSDAQHTSERSQRRTTGRSTRRDGDAESPSR